MLELRCQPLTVYLMMILSLSVLSWKPSNIFITRSSNLHRTSLMMRKEEQTPISGTPDYKRNEDKERSIMTQARWLQISSAMILSATMMMAMSPITSSEVNAEETKSVASQIEDVADEITDYATILTTPSNEKVLQVPESQQSAGWEKARAKRTAAVKKMADQGIVKLDTDDDGNQVLSVPWWNQKLQYKSLTLVQKLEGEVVAGAIGELAKDVLLHPIDTLKSRKQADLGSNEEEEEKEEGNVEDEYTIKDGGMETNSYDTEKERPVERDECQGSVLQEAGKRNMKKAFIVVGSTQAEGSSLPLSFADKDLESGLKVTNSVTDDDLSTSGAPGAHQQEAAGNRDGSPLRGLQELYAGFPAVVTSSLPQGGVFFLCKKGGIEIIKRLSPEFASSLLGQAIPVIPGSVGYWGVRTPSEIVKLKVQLGQSPTVKDAVVDVSKQIQDKGVLSLWKFYPSLLALDIPYAILNFAMYGIFNDYIAGLGIEASVYTRLVSGAACGMIAAAATCPIDVAKTRIISRAKDSNDEEEYGEGEIDQNVIKEMANILSEEGIASLFTGLKERTLYVGLSNAIRLAAYSTSRMDLMLRSFDSL